MTEGQPKEVNKWWGVLPILAVVWHGVHTVQYWHWQHLLFFCFAANLLIGFGLLLRQKIMTGVGLCFVTIGLPLWILHSISINNWPLSGTVFHLSGVVLGLYSIRKAKLSSYTGISSVIFGGTIFILSRLFTKPEFNINGVYNVFFKDLQGYMSAKVYLPLYILLGLTYCLVFPLIINKMFIGKIS